MALVADIDVHCPLSLHLLLIDLYFGSLFDVFFGIDVQIITFFPGHSLRAPSLMNMTEAV